MQQTQQGIIYVNLTQKTLYRFKCLLALIPYVTKSVKSACGFASLSVPMNPVCVNVAINSGNLSLQSLVLSLKRHDSVLISLSIVLKSWENLIYFSYTCLWENQRVSAFQDTIRTCSSMVRGNRKIHAWEEEHHFQMFYAFFGFEMERYFFGILLFRLYLTRRRPTRWARYECLVSKQRWFFFFLHFKLFFLVCDVDLDLFTYLVAESR